MRALFFTFVVLLSAASVFAQSQSSPPSHIPTPGITAEHLYNGVNRKARITVTSPRSFGTITLALMDFEGQPLTDPITVHPGIIDLAEMLPSIWTIRRTAYVQLIDGQTPIGSALVLQPMLSRMVPLTEVQPHPTRETLHSRIVGWMDENEPAMQEPPKGDKQKSEVRDQKSDNAEPTPEGSKDTNPNSKIENPKSIDRLFTGLRIYPERDVVLHTTLGDIRLAMKPDDAPNTVWNFLELCRGGFYRDVQFHRIVPLTANGLPFVIQAGDPTSTGDGGPGYWLPLEDSKLPHDFGVISMARSDDPDSNGSQFFIALSREGTARLDGQYCSFGYAVDSADSAMTILAIAQVPLADVAAGRPANPPLIKGAELVPSPPRAVRNESTSGGGGRPDQRVTPESKPAEPKPTGRIPR